jgi:hypothetical protein
MTLNRPNPQHVRLKFPQHLQAYVGQTLTMIGSSVMTTTIASNARTPDHLTLQRQG